MLHVRSEILSREGVSLCEQKRKVCDIDKRYEIKTVAIFGCLRQEEDETSYNWCAIYRFTHIKFKHRNNYDAHRRGVCM